MGCIINLGVHRRGTLWEAREGRREEVGGGRRRGERERRETGEEEERNQKKVRSQGEGGGEQGGPAVGERRKGLGSPLELWPPVHLEEGRKEPKIKEKQGSGSLPPWVTLRCVYMCAHVCLCRT